MKKAFRNTCIYCGVLSVFHKYTIKDLCPTVQFFVISFAGGFRAYSFKEIAVLLGIKEQIIIGQCENCQSIVTKCPYCGNLMSKEEGLEKKCTDCHKSFYLCI